MNSTKKKQQKEPNNRDLAHIFIYIWKHTHIHSQARSSIIYYVIFFWL